MRHLLLLVALIFTVLPCGAVITDPPVAIPVFFATDRQLDFHHATNINYTNDQLTDPALNFGLKNIVVTGKDLPDGSDARALGLGWWNPVPASAGESPALPNVTLTRAEIIERLKEIVLSGPKNRPLVIFVNGCCQPFDTAMNYAGNMSRHIQAPVLLYAWAAIPPTTKKYRENEMRERQGEKRFSDFLTDLEREIPADRIVLVGYSMGNRLVFHGLRQRYFDHGSNDSYAKLRGVALACADVNVDDFVSDKDYVAFNSDNIWVTKNDFDKALNMSQLQRGLYGRLGAPKGSTNKLLSTSSINVLDIHPLMGWSHDFPYAFLTETIRRSEGGIMPKFKVMQLKPHLFKVEKL